VPHCLERKKQMTTGIFNSTVSGTPAVSATGSNGADGIDASTDTGTAVNAVCSGSGPGSGLLPTGIAISATGPTGISATSNTQFGIGVHAVGGGATVTEDVPTGQAAIFAEGGPGPGLYATSNGSSAAVNGAGTNGAAGVTGSSDSGIGVHAVGGGASPATPPPVTAAAILAEGGPGTGVFATADTGAAVNAICNTGIAVSASGIVGVSANSTTGPGVSSTSISGVSVDASSERGVGVQGSSGTSAGVSGFTETGIGVKANGGIGGVALQVIGKVEVQGNSVGTVTMGTTTTLTVPNPAATPNSLIFLTPLADPQAFLWIAARKAGSFTIDASKKLPAPVNIMFLIIN
jgi:hypothetical protein